MAQALKSDRLQTGRKQKQKTENRGPSRGPSVKLQQLDIPRHGLWRRIYTIVYRHSRTRRLEKKDLRGETRIHAIKSPRKANAFRRPPSLEMRQSITSVRLTTCVHPSPLATCMHRAATQHEDLRATRELLAPQMKPALLVEVRHADNGCPTQPVRALSQARRTAWHALRPPAPRCP